MILTRGDFSGFVKVSGFINFRVLGLVGVYTEGTVGFLTVYTTDATMTPGTFMMEWLT